MYELDIWENDKVTQEYYEDYAEAQRDFDAKVDEFGPRGIEEGDGFEYEVSLTYRFIGSTDEEVIWLATKTPDGVDVAYKPGTVHESFISKI